MVTHTTVPSDGGGIRGLSELHIIRKMMEQLKNQNNLESVPRPCEWFDMIAGSNTGGCIANLVSNTDYPLTRIGLRIIALFLGRLRMTADEATKAYNSLSEQVFSDAKWVGEQQYKASKLEEVLKAIIRAKTGNSETRMMIAQSDCKV